MSECMPTDVRQSRWWTFMSESTCTRLVHARSKAGHPEGELCCERCGEAVAVTRHHRKKRSHLSKNKLWEASNVVVLCGHGTAGCHGWVEDNPDAAAVQGYHVRPWEDPREIPVSMWWSLAKVFIDDEGGWTVDAPRAVRMQPDTP